MAMTRQEELFSFSHRACELADLVESLSISGTRTQMAELERLLKIVKEFN